jgi:hypothetical protein
VSQQQQQAQEVVHPSQIVDITQQDDPNGYYLKVFLLDDSINHAKWRVKTDSIPKHIQKFVGRPFILTKEHYHPLEFENVSIDYNDIPATVNKLLETQDQYKIGTIRKVERSINPAQAAYGATWNAYVEITDPVAVQAFKNGYTPRYVSASVFRLNEHESPQETTDFEPLHLAAVDNPAYGIHKAGVRGACQGNLTKCSKQLAQASVYSSLTNSNTTERTDNLSTDNAEASQQQQPNVTQSTPGIPTTAADNNNAAASQSQQPSQQQQTQPQQLRPVTGNTAPFEVQKQVEQPKQSAEQQPQQQQSQTNMVEGMATLITKYEALLNRVNELETFKQTAQKTEEETKTAAKRTKIENVIPADYADSPEERTKAIESLMKMPDGPELDYFLQKFVTPVTAPKDKPVQEASNKTSFMRAKRVTDYAQTTKTPKQKGSVQQAATNSPDNLDLSRLRRICSMTDIVSNTSNSGGAF